MNNGYALYISSFPPQRYRRPILASRSLRLIGLKTLFYSGWSLANRYKTLKHLTALSNRLPRPMNWLAKDAAYELGIYIGLQAATPACIINLNAVGALSLKQKLGNEAPLILDLQDVTIQDDGTLPLYDRWMMKMADLAIFASRSIQQLVHKRHGKLLKSSAYIPFGIDLNSFDKAYNLASAEHFKNLHNLAHEKIITYTGAAYLWGEREGQGLDLLVEAVAKVVRHIPRLKAIIQGAAEPGTFMWRWIESRIRKNSLEGKILLMPPTSPLDPLRLGMLKASSALLLPIGDILGTYYAEQQKLFEYMAAARPIAMVATPARLNVLDAGSAYIAYNRDPDEFAYQIVRALEEQAEADTKAQRARKTVEENYDWKTLAPKYAEAIARVLKTT